MDIRSRVAKVSSLIVRGGRPLRGRLIPSANKNAVLPILCATLLTDEPVVLRGVPDITDVQQILGLFEALGSDVVMDHETRILRVCHG
jgi:UDP-N-acetylglucosamine 1-carboxyvinyltransferase